MTTYYPEQTTAISAAKRQRMTLFDTVYTTGEGWSITRTEGPQAEWAKAWASDVMVDAVPRNAGAFVSHVGERHGKPLLVITCHLDEITPEDNIPPEFEIASHLPSLWINDAGELAKFGVKGDRAQRTTNSGTDARLNPDLRSRSTFEGSPVKFVHGMCDEMHAAGLFDRKQAIAKALEAGVTKNTATAQVYRWRKNNDM